MENITNKTLFTTILIIGVVLALMIIPLYPNNGTSLNGRNLGANAYFDNNNFDYINLDTNYDVVPFRTSTTRTITETSSTPSTQTYYYTTTETVPNLPNENSYNGSYYYGNGYTPPGCESGTDYSLTTGEPCG